MARGEAQVIVHFKDLEHDAELQEAIERRCGQLANEFHETDRYELHLEPEASGIKASAHVTGKGTSLAAHSHADETRRAGESALDKIERELRKEHDKRIFVQRREAQKSRRSR